MKNQNAITKRELEKYKLKSRKIRDATVSSRNLNETEAEKELRIKSLLADPVKFCEYYFGYYMTASFGWFHKQALKEVAKYKNDWFVWEWPREHAKSVLMDIFVPLYLKAKGELTGMVLASQNEKKAKILLGDVQAQLENNQRYIDDFGLQIGGGSWSEGEFITSDDLGFWAIGRGQSPRGIRNGKYRPNLIIIDDIDDSEICRNRERVLNAEEWIRTDLYGCAPLEGSRVIIGGNRIHQYSILAHLVGDVEEGDVVSPDIRHIKVYAIEDENRQASSRANPKARPAWKEKYTFEMLDIKFTKMGYNGAQREYFHRHIPKGTTFKGKDVYWATLPKLSEYDALVSYCDPSFKDNADYKAVVLMGRIGKYFDVISIWLQQSSPLRMAEAHFEIVKDTLNLNAKHLFEANFAQDSHKKTYDEVAKKMRLPNLIKKDLESKPDKHGRIESLSALWENGHWRFNAALKNDPNMKTLVNQFLGFPKGHDDGPDACHGAYRVLLKFAPKGSGKKARTGRYYKNTDRYIG